MNARNETEHDGPINNGRPSYTTHDPRGWCGDPRRGAAMGRSTIHDVPRMARIKLTLRRIRLDAGGYDPNGTYFGHGSPLFWYAGADVDGNEIDAMVRVSDRAAAKREILREYPEARFYR